MKRILGFCLALLLLVTAALPAFAAGPNGDITINLDEGEAGKYAGVTVPVVRLKLNGESLPADVPAFIRDGRTMVPVRVISEKMGAKVTWMDETNQVMVSLNGTDVTLKIGSAKALVNGEEVALDDDTRAVVATMRIDGKDTARTMVPLRFISEQLGAQVGWDQGSYTATVKTNSAANQIKRVSADANAQTVHIVTSAKPNYKVSDFGDRVVLDFFDTGLASGFGGRILVDNELISEVRFAQHDNTLYSDYDDTVRVVVGLKEGVTYSDNVELTDLPQGVMLTTFFEQRGEVDFTPSKPIDPQKRTVVLDAGHGGSQTGALYEGIKEKDINLAVTKKVEQILLQHGYNVVLTRSGDTTVGLYERADIANAVNADIFVSMHSNAVENNNDYQGIFTFYHPTSKRGARLAQAIQTPLCKSTGGTDRGIRSADYVVIRETEMCAVLVEMGFMTNSEELQRLASAGYQDKLAAGIAEGIVSYLNALE